MNEKLDPHISVIMSVYNGEKYVSEAIESVLSQTYDNFELLVIDDCSTDNTYEIIKSFNDSRIIAFKNTENKGLTSNLNLLIKKSRGKFIARLDADDVCAPMRLEAQYNYLLHHKETFLVFSGVRCFGEIERSVNTPADYEHVKANLLFGNPITHSSVMFRNTKDYYYDETYVKSQDYELWDRIIAEGKIIEPMQDILVYQRIHPGQITKVDTESQEKLNSKVIIRALSRLGLVLSDYERQVYIDAIRKKTIKNDKDWYIFKNLLVEIEFQNRQNNIYKPRALKTEISKYYIMLIKCVIRGKIFDSGITSVKNILSCLRHIGFGNITKYLRGL